MLTFNIYFKTVSQYYSERQAANFDLKTALSCWSDRKIQQPKI